MPRFRIAASTALLAAILPCAVMAQKQRSAPAKLPALEFMGYRLGMSRAQADSLTAAHGWKYTMTADDMVETSAPDAGDEGAPSSIGGAFCEPGADNTGCAMVKSVGLSFKKDKVSEIDVSSIMWSLDHCADSWNWQKTVRAGFTALYGKPTEEPGATLKPEMLATLDEPKTTVSWMMPKANYGFTQGVNVSVLHTDALCWSTIMIWDMSELYD